MNISDNEREVRRKYGDILNAKRPEPKGRTPMSMAARGAQFAPFSALSGLDEVMDDTVSRNEENVAAEIEKAAIEDI